jgi:hypothetical protein
MEISKVLLQQEVFSGEGGRREAKGRKAYSKQDRVQRPG